jgi:uncharacterized protein (TIGR04222 family)
MGPEAEPPRDTWGISGPVFLAGYAVLILGTFGGMIWAQRRIWRSSSPERIDFEDLDPCEVGLLRSRELAITVALLALEKRGAVVLDASEVPLAARIEWVPPHQPRCRIELAIRDALLDLDATRPGERHSTSDVATRASGLLGRAEQALEDKGLKPSPEVARRLRRTLLWSAPVVALGVVRLAYGLGRGDAVEALGYALVGVVLYVASRLPAGSWTPPAVVAARRRWKERQAREPRRTRTKAALPDGVPPSPIEVAVGGTRALWTAAPGLAASLGAPGPPWGAAGCGVPDRRSGVSQVRGT